MAHTYPEMLAALLKLDELSLLELLDISTEELVNTYLTDLIEEKQEYIRLALELE